MDLLSILLAETVDGRWQPGIGDPSVMGWLTVLAYLGTAYLAWQASRDVRRLRQGVALTRFWLGLALFLLVLGINKQLDLQSWLTQTAKDMAREQGWYEDRRGIQLAFIAIVAVVGLVAIAATGWMLRKVWRRDWPAIVGAGLLTVFVVARASSFHHMDRLIKADIGGIRMNWILELTGIGLIAWGAATRLGFSPWRRWTRHLKRR